MQQSKVKLLAISSLAACLLVVVAVLFFRGGGDPRIVTPGDPTIAGVPGGAPDAGPDRPKILVDGVWVEDTDPPPPGMIRDPKTGEIVNDPMVNQNGDRITTGTVHELPPGSRVGGPGLGELIELTKEQLDDLEKQRQADKAAADAKNGTGTGTAGDIGTGGIAEEDVDREPEEGEVLIAGRVLRGEEPITNAHITMNHPGGFLEARTGEDGSYRFAPAVAGEIVLYLQDPPSPQPRRGLFVNAGENRLAEDFIIPASPPVQGEVIDLDSGERIANAEVKVLEGDRLIGSVKSDGGGQFELFPLDPGIYRVEGHATGYEVGDKAFEVFETRATPNVLLEIKGSRVAAGRVESATGAPVSGALVGLFGAWAYSDPFASVGTQVTDGSGRFRFSIPSDPNLSEFRVGAYKEGETPGFSATYNVASLTSEDIVVRLPKGATITGRLLESEEILIDGAEVAVREGFATTGAIHQRFNVTHDQTTLTGNDGRFTLSGIEAGSTTLNFAAETYISTEKTVEAIDGQTVDIGDVVMEGEDGARPGRIFGVVIDDRQTPMRDHAVLIRGVDGSQNTVRTDSRGKFKIDGLADGDYAIFTNGSLLRGDVFIVVDQTNPFVRAGDDLTYLLYDMGQAARMTVRLASGRAVSSFRVGVRVRSNGPQGNGGVNETFGEGFDHVFQSSNGELLIEGLLAGTADFTISVDGEGTEEIKNVTIPVGGTADLGDITIGSGSTLTGKVVSAFDGTSLSGMSVEVSAPDNAAPNHPLNVLPQKTQTGVDGRFTVTGLPEGAAVLVLKKSGFVTERREISVQASGPNDLGQISVEGSAILRGTITDQAGKALNDIQVTIGSELVFTDREGRYYLDSLSPGTVTIIAFDHTGRHSKTTLEATLNPDQANVYDLAMPIAGP